MSLTNTLMLPARRGIGLAAPAIAALSIVALSHPAHAYVGPGAGLTAIGTVLALLAAVGLAIVGFVWYPIRRLARRRKSAATGHDQPGADERP